ETGFEPVFESRSRFRQCASAVAQQHRRSNGTRLKHAAVKFAGSYRGLDLNRRNQRLRAEPATAVRIGASSVSSISSKVRPRGSNPNTQKPISPSTYHDAKYMNVGPSITRFGAAGLMRSPAPMIKASPSGPTNLPRLPTP